MKNQRSDDRKKLIGDEARIVLLGILAAAMWAKFAMEKQGRMKGYGMDYSMKIVKEIYKSQVYCVKNKTFINFALENRR